MAIETRYHYAYKAYSSEDPSENDPVEKDPIDNPDVSEGEGADNPDDVSLEDELGLGTDDPSAPQLPTDVSLDELRDLFYKVQNGQVQLDEGKLPFEEALDILLQAMRDEKNGFDDKSLEGFGKVLSAEKSDGTDGDDLGDKPNRVENGTNYYEKPGEDGGTPTLYASGKSSDNVVTVDVELNPKAPEDLVEVKEDGDYLVVKLTHEGMTDTFRCSKKVRILSNHVTGDVDSDKLSVGAEGSERYISEEKLENIAKKIQNSLGLMGYHVATSEEYEVDGWGPGFMDADSTGIRDTGNSSGGGTKYTVGYVGRKGSTDDHNHWVGYAQTEVKKVTEVLALIPKAIKEKDPDKKTKLWDKIVQTVKTWSTQYENKGHTNNICAFFTNTLHMELGDEGFREALELKILPPELAQAIADGLVLQADEKNNATTELAWQSAGSDGLTHESKAEMWRHYSGVMAPTPAPAGDQPAG